MKVYESTYGYRILFKRWSYCINRKGTKAFWVPLKAKTLKRPILDKAI